MKFMPVRKAQLLSLALLALLASPVWAVELTAKTLVALSKESRIYDGVSLHGDKIFFTTYNGDNSLLFKAATTGLGIQPEIAAKLPEGSRAAGTTVDSKGGLWLADFKKHQILHLPAGKNEIEVFITVKEMSQPNDLVITKDGTLYASDPNWSKKSGRIWKITPDKKATVIKAGLGVANGIALSPDERTLYIAESNSGRLVSFDLSPGQEKLGEPTLIKDYPDFALDGIAVDSEGLIYVPLMKTPGTPGRLLEVLNPKGDLIAKHQLLGEYPSNIALSKEKSPEIYLSQFGKESQGAFVEKLSRGEAEAKTK